jgi:hypothetical protein
MTEIDTSKPNAARVYDYLLGGSNNFEADRAAAEYMLKQMPTASNGARLHRWFMLGAVERLSQANFSCYLDLATGLPTQNYIHDLVPHAKVLYNDIDPVTVAYAQQIIGDNPNVRYLQSNILDLPTILKAADEHFAGERKVGICFVGVSYFFTDAQLQSILDTLYDWAAPGTEMALSWLTFPEVHDEALTKVLENYRRMQVELYSRTPDDIRAMLGAWQVRDPGMLPINEWSSMDNSWREGAPADGDMYGCIVQKQ